MPEDRDAETLPDAGDTGAGDELALKLGEPFAMVSGCAILERNDAAGIPGAAVAVQCECGKRFRIDLTADSRSLCPGCKTAFTHALLLCVVDDDEIAGDAIAHIFEQNGFVPPGDEGPELEGDDDDDDGQRQGE